jgi:hypothetical protein
MKFLGSLLFAVAITTISIVPAQAQNNADGSPWTISSLVPQAVDFVNQFWAEEFDGMNLVYTPPTSINRYFGSTRTACGPTTIRTAFYCTVSHSIHYEYNFLNRALVNIGDFAAASVIAHEWGHAVQAQLGLFTATSVARELQADCFTGAFGKWLDEAGNLDPGDFEEGRTLFEQLGDPDDTSPDSDEAHGTSAQRSESYETGFTEGVSGCMA